VVGLLKGQLQAAMRGHWLQAKQLDLPASGPPGQQPGPHHTGVVENEERAGRQLTGQVAEVFIGKLAVAAHEELAGSAVGEGLGRNALGGQRISEILNGKQARVGVHSAKVALYRKL
jgi:hypothetical protein